MDIIGDKESDAVSKKTVALTKKNIHVTSVSPTQRAVDQEHEQPIPVTIHKGKASQTTH